MASSLTDVFQALDHVFQKVSLRWYVFGAQAVAFYGAARFSADVDVTLLAENYPIGDLMSALRAKEFVTRVSDVERMVHQTRVVPVVHAPSRIPVDIVLGGAGLEEEFAKNVQYHDLEDLKIPVANSADLIAMKIFSGRDKDLQDAQAVLQVQRGNVDTEAVRKTLKILETALDRSDLVLVLDKMLSKLKS